MKVSVITPTFNSGKVVATNIESVNRQTYPDIEHVFVDNCSSDETLELIESLSTRKKSVVSEKDKGISDAFNKGVRRANGEITIILNSDDYFLDEQAVARAVSAFQSVPGVYIVHGDIFFEDEEQGSNVRRPINRTPKLGMPFNQPAMFIHRAAYRDVGEYSLEYRYAMDFEWVCRLVKLKGPVASFSRYLSGKPLSLMRAGGASWQFEEKSVLESIRALKANDLYDFEAKRAMWARLMRVKIKAVLPSALRAGVVKAWRRLKWR